MNILLTGGAGYIGSHTALECLRVGHAVTLLDNFSNSSPLALERLREISGGVLELVCADVRDGAALKRLFSERHFDAVMHFAGLKAVGESVAQPLRYYDNNVGGTLSLLAAMSDAGVKTLVFSSSATVYGDPHSVPIQEHFPLSATNPYGRSKLIVEEVLGDLCLADADWSVGLLRYFNPVGADVSGRIGEDPRGVPNNLVPYIAQVAIGLRDRLRVFGGDYPTPDGTGVRDYLHVTDLARGHIAALGYVAAHKGIRAWNLGTGRGVSVLEMVRAFERACGRAIPCEIVARRPGDIAACWADPARACVELGWQAELGLDRMCEDTWRWQSLNPHGYC